MGNFFEKNIQPLQFPGKTSGHLAEVLVKKMFFGKFSCFCSRCFKCVFFQWRWKFKNFSLHVSDAFPPMMADGSWLAFVPVCLKES